VLDFTNTVANSPRHPGESRGPDVVPIKAGNQFSFLDSGESWGEVP